ncbi:CBS domain-containing protein [Desulfobacula phenolica]|uniref:histidine kinase n=2 Tax=Desulfobacula phenolica TaxID=90732 RepID=A0A1H2H3B8_9BACT|nr:CBS domain-containing protein [Desulfobacula phenolica]
MKTFTADSMNRISYISKKAYTVLQDDPVSSVKEFFDKNKPVNAVVVVQGSKILGLVMNIHMNFCLSQRYGFSLFINKPVCAIMDKSPMIVCHDESIEDVASKAMKRESNRIYDHIIVVKNGHLNGIVSVKTILNFLVKSQRERTNILERYATMLEREDTDKKKAIQGLKASKMEAIGRLAGGVAHDLNNILSGIINYPELMMMELPENSNLIKPLKIIQASGERAAAVVQDLLTFSRRGRVNKDMLNLNSIVWQCIYSPEFFRLKLEFPLIRIKNELEPQLMVIEGSCTHLNKLIVNLVNNSAEAIEGPGKIIIKTFNQCFDNRYHKLSHLNSLPGDDSVRQGEYVGLSVSDNGPGISKDDMDKIFEPFYTNKKIDRDGQGLGMAVVWGTVKELGGYIDVSSKPGNGTVVTIFFPAKKRTLELVPNVCLLENRKSQ